MQPLSRDRLRGTWGAVLLPLADDDSVEWGLLRDEVEVLVGMGLAGLYTNGSAGELHSLEESEVDGVNEIVAQACTKANLPFQIGASQMSGQICLSRIRRARELAPSAIQVILPDWFPLATREVMAAVERMAEVADPVPLVLYNPPHAKTRCDPEEFGRLAAAVPGLVGIKVAGGDADWYKEMRAAAPDLAVFVAGHALASGRQQGAAGAYSNVACLNPAGALAWERQMSEDPEAALELEKRINEFLALHIFPIQARGFSNAALDKTLARIGGWAEVGTRVRWPYSSVPEAEAAALAPIARAELPELFSA
ncbi:MAG: Dihydrodipicolinate synthase/N-acetylneuraminate lyase [Acidimicrobiaceae bacterium]|nr:Dihydrodipicolinate synthase/N-acetylneuraminate lyase [Acidimicrobiaceae bacterium]